MTTPNLLTAKREVAPLPIIDFVDGWEGSPPAREFAWGVDLPLRQTTMLTGRGGIGKSLLAQQLATAVALGKPFLGRETRPMRALYVTCEDDADELWRRQSDICEALGLPLEDKANRMALDTRLTLVSLCGAVDTDLVRFEADGGLRTTDGWAALVEAVRHTESRFIVFDNATDALAADHNDVHQVAAFVNLLTSLAIERNGAFLILHHPNKGDQDWLGSVAWHNKVRSRLLLKSAERAGDADARILVNGKANYSAAGGQTELRWHRGCFVSDAELPDSMRSELEATARASADNDLFLACLRQRTKERRAVSEQPSPTYAPAIFDKMTDSRNIGRARLEAAMNRLFRIEAIERAELWRGPDRKPVFGLREKVR